MLLSHSLISVILLLFHFLFQGMHFTAYVLSFLHCQQDEVSDPSTCLSIGETIPRVLDPVMHSLAQEGHGVAGASPTQGYKDDYTEQPSVS